MSCVLGMSHSFHLASLACYLSSSLMLFLRHPAPPLVGYWYQVAMKLCFTAFSVGFWRDCHFTGRKGNGISENGAIADRHRRFGARALCITLFSL
ncbi:hypothetical protein F5Y18DRAFT_116565 [Xylariaceae sp. FL1019]|nr:hypothetical protein F5Y18DRAFT_116565 [Xylariaceae sp. FL1019]